MRQDKLEFGARKDVLGMVNWTIGYHEYFLNTTEFWPPRALLEHDKLDFGFLGDFWNTINWILKLRGLQIDIWDAINWTLNSKRGVKPLDNWVAKRQRSAVSYLAAPFLMTIPPPPPPSRARGRGGGCQRPRLPHRAGAQLQ
ncbi:hypothetical protein CEXT_230571 [Caerostris extrusa]|uniref:Uncharacterized protein n=1 Tax=Caerostris extrusa TaxID=172846 RepID=A0AAV4U9T2_CAEEX|nr:hypothetical protein CEXT_230571 [Caerostris extrusa]